MENDNLETWAIIELMGHVVLAGFVRERNIAGTGFLQVDIPKIGDRAGFSQMVNPASIYRLTPTDEQTAKIATLHNSVYAIPFELARVRGEHMIDTGGASF